MKPTDIYNIHDEKEDNMKIQDHTETIEKQEVWNLIDKHLDIKYRADYIKIRNNIKIPKQRRLEIEQEIIKIIKRFYNYANN